MWKVSISWCLASCDSPLDMTWCFTMMLGWFPLEKWLSGGFVLRHLHMDKQPWNCRLAFAFLHPLTLPLERVMHQDPSNHRKTPGCKKRVTFRSQIQSGNYWFYMILHHLQKCTMDMDGVSAAGNAVMLVNSHHLTFSHVFLGGGNCRRSHLEYLGNFIATSTECRWLTDSTWYAYLAHIHWTYNVHHILYIINIIWSNIIW